MKCQFPPSWGGGGGGTRPRYLIGGGGIAPPNCTRVSQCKSASAPCKNFLWRLWRLVFPMLSGPSDRSPPWGGRGRGDWQGRGDCKGGGGYLWDWPTPRKDRGHCPLLRIPQRKPSGDQPRPPFRGAAGYKMVGRDVCRPTLMVSWSGNAYMQLSPGWDHAHVVCATGMCVVCVRHPPQKRVP